MLLCDHNFTGPLDIDAPALRGGAAGVYVIVCQCRDGRKRMVHADHARNLPPEISSSANRQAWAKAYEGNLSAYALYQEAPETPETCQALVLAIRNRYAPWCARPPEQIGAASRRP